MPDWVENKASQLLLHERQVKSYIQGQIYVILERKWQVLNGNTAGTLVWNSFDSRKCHINLGLTIFHRSMTTEIWFRNSYSGRSGGVDLELTKLRPCILTATPIMWPGI